MNKLQLSTVVLLLTAMFCSNVEAQNNLRTFDDSEITSRLLEDIECQDPELCPLPVSIQQYDDAPELGMPFQDLDPGNLDSEPDFFDGWTPPWRKKPDPGQPAPTPAPQPPADGGWDWEWGWDFPLLRAVFGGSFGMLLAGFAIIMLLGFINDIMTPIAGPDWVRNYVSGAIHSIKGFFLGVYDGFTKSPEVEYEYVDVDEDGNEIVEEEE